MGLTVVEYVDDPEGPIHFTITDGPSAMTWFGNDGRWHHVIGANDAEFQSALKAEEALEAQAVEAIGRG